MTAQRRANARDRGLLLLDLLVTRDCQTVLGPTAYQRRGQVCGRSHLNYGLDWRGLEAHGFEWSTRTRAALKWLPSLCAQRNEERGTRLHHPPCGPKSGNRYKVVNNARHVLDDYLGLTLVSDGIHRREDYSLDYMYSHQGDLESENERALVRVLHDQRAAVVDAQAEFEEEIAELVAAIRRERRLDRPA